MYIIHYSIVDVHGLGLCLIVAEECERIDPLNQRQHFIGIEHALRAYNQTGKIIAHDAFTGEKRRCEFSCPHRLSPAPVDWSCPVRQRCSDYREKKCMRHRNNVTNDRVNCRITDGRSGRTSSE